MLCYIMLSSRQSPGAAPGAPTSGARVGGVFCTHRYRQGCGGYCHCHDTCERHQHHHHHAHPFVGRACDISVIIITIIIIAIAMIIKSSLVSSTIEAIVEVHVHVPVPRTRVLSYVGELFTLLDLCVSSLRRGHANLLCIVPTLTDDPRRESALLGRWIYTSRSPGGCRKLVGDAGLRGRGPQPLAPEHSRVGTGLMGT